MPKAILLVFLCTLGYALPAQTHDDFLGAGHDDGIIVTTSHNASPNQDGTTSVDGFPVTNPILLADASRFLAQATLGYDYEMVQMVAAMGYDAWLDEQFSLPRQNFTDLGVPIEATYGDAGTGLTNFRGAWWNYALRSPDALRQRLNYNLSEIFVVSGFMNDEFEDDAGLSNVYYDVLGNHAFANFRQLLSAVSRNASMGIYLSHLNNPRADPANNIHPDENYAREVMQLFSIGLYELNPDGTRMVDGSGNFIPTYDNDDIREFAKIFTGFGNGDPNGEWGSRPFTDEGTTYDLFVATPMRMYEAWHEPGEKRLLNGQVVPAGQLGLADFEAAMDNLYNHQNVGPFIGKALIQLLVSSNPSPEYVSRVTAAFNNNGQGVRGDMQAVIRAILLDPEARNCSPLDAPTAGKLREPVLRMSGFLKAFNARVTQNGGLFLGFMGALGDNTGQIPLFAPSVFNFYLPDFQPQGLIAAADLVAPVFQIHNSSTAIGYVNLAHQWTFEEGYLDPTNPTLDFSDEVALADDPAAIVDRLDILLACGQLSDRTKTIITSALALVESEDRVPLALDLLLISPDFVFLK